MPNQVSNGNSYESIMAIAAHPDDVELGCAGTIMMEKMKGKKAFIVDLTRGELGTRGTNETRAEEAEAAFKLMGVDGRENLGIADGFFQNDKKSQLAVIGAIRKYRPGIILTNAPADRHPDHGRAASLVKDAAWLSGLNKIETVVNNENLPAWRPAYVFHFIQDKYLHPSFVYDITPVMDRKIEAIKAYRTQFDTAPDNEPQTYISTPEFLQSIIDRARMFGRMIGVPYAEGFITDKVPGIDAFDSLIQNIT
jgi:bacillithiol biosynthesis deacetylase BshB1